MNDRRRQEIAEQVKIQEVQEKDLIKRLVRCLLAVWFILLFDHSHLYPFSFPTLFLLLPLSPLSLLSLSVCVCVSLSVSFTYVVFVDSPCVE